MPFERSDVLALASGLDDVVDYAEEAGDFLGLYRVEAPMDQAIALADTLAAAGPFGGRGAGRARGTCPRRRAPPPRARSSGSSTRAIGSLREGLSALFDGGVDPMMVIRWKDIFERVEDDIDACDRVAHLLRGITVKGA